jgi:hypothetical protein
MAAHTNQLHLPAAPALRLAPARRAGLTLAELSVSLAVIATLMVATGSIMVLTGRAVAITAAQASEARVDDVIATMASEQRMALAVTDRSSTSVTFTVADRDGDGVAETIHYQYDPIKKEMSKQINAGPLYVVLREVKTFGITYVTKTEAAAVAGPDVESTTDDVVYVHDSTSASNYGVSALNWAGESFVATLGRPDATSWRVTSVEVMGTRTGGSASWTVILCPVDSAGKPNTLAPIEKSVVSSSVLPTTLGWSQLIKFVNVDQKLNPTTRYCVVITQPLLGTSGSLSIDGASTDATGVALKSGTAGGIWTVPAGQDLRIRIKGRYKYPGS